VVVIIIEVYFKPEVLYCATARTYVCSKYFLEPTATIFKFGQSLKTNV